MKNEYKSLMMLAKKQSISPQELSCQLAVAGKFVPGSSLSATLQKMNKNMSREDFMQTVSNVIVYHEEAILKKIGMKAKEYRDGLKSMYAEFKKYRNKVKKAKAKIRKDKSVREELEKIEDFADKVKYYEATLEDTPLGKMLIAAARKKGFKPKDDSDLEKMEQARIGVAAIYEVIGQKRMRMLLKELRKVDTDELIKKTKSKWKIALYKIIAAMKGGKNILMAVPLLIVVPMILPPFILAPVIFVLFVGIFGSTLGPAIVVGAMLYTIICILFDSFKGLVTDKNKRSRQAIDNNLEKSSMHPTINVFKEMEDEFVSVGFSRQESRSLVESSFAYA